MRRRRIPSNAVDSQRRSKDTPHTPFNPLYNPDIGKPVKAEQGAPPEVDGFNISVFQGRPALMTDFQLSVGLNNIAGDTNGVIRAVGGGPIGNLLQWFGIVVPSGFRMILKKVVIAGTTSYEPPFEAGPIFISAKGIGADPPGGGGNMVPTMNAIIRQNDQPVIFQAIDSGVEFGNDAIGLTHFPYAPIVWRGYIRMEETDFVTFDFFQPGFATFWEFSGQTKATFYGSIQATDANELQSLGMTKLPVPVQEQGFDVFDKSGNRLFRKRGR